MAGEPRHARPTDLGASRVFSSSNPEEIKALIDLSGQELRWTPRARDNGELRVTQFGRLPVTGLARISFSSHETLFDLDAELRVEEPEDVYVVHLPIPGVQHPVPDVNGEEIQSPHAILGPDEPHRWTRLRNATLMTLSIQGSDFRAALADRLGDTPATRLRFNPEINTADPGIASWVQLAQTYLHLSRSGFAAASPLTDSHLRQALLYGLLDMQPHSLTDAMTDHHVRAHSAAVTKVREYCEDNAAEPITISELAAASHTTVRALQRAFRRELDTTPMEYLRQVRLAKVHAELIAIGKGEIRGTIAEVAANWGFYHQARFAQSYRQRYGHLPKRTVRD
ncbi:AraC family transcriptional regulator [Crossiella sp. CA198]|uniref:helix-turn-helix transcriptional regulator n=1 Tax=Crossiella sp. CA198 TaxID=3455607 RepID=UPI003F8D7B31